MNEKWLIVVYGFCIGQFIVTLIYVISFCKPATKLDMALVGLSAAIGILLSGIIRRGYKSYKAYSDKKTAYHNLDETLRKIREQKRD